MRSKDSPHEDAGAAAPDAGLDQVARDARVQNRLDRLLELVEPGEADHRLGVERPVTALLAHIPIQRLRRPLGVGGVAGLILECKPRQRLLEQFEVQGDGRTRRFAADTQPDRILPSVAAPFLSNARIQAKRRGGTIRSRTTSEGDRVSVAVQFRPGNGE